MSIGVLPYFLLLGVLLPLAKVWGQPEPEKVGVQGYQGQKRVLLLMAPAAGHPALAGQQQFFAGQQQAFGERDLVLVEEVEDQWLKVGEGEQAASGLRQRYRVSPDSFALILIGKDGSEKCRSASPVAPEKSYSLIDSMPMRRAEMKENQK